MSIRQVIIVAPVSLISLVRLKERGYQLYATCEGIKEAVQIRQIRNLSSPVDDLQFHGPFVQIGYWGYRWIPVSKIKRVVGQRMEPDQRTPWSQNVSSTITPGGHK